MHWQGFPTSDHYAVWSDNLNGPGHRVQRQSLPNTQFLEKNWYGAFVSAFAFGIGEPFTQGG